MSRKRRIAAWIAPPVALGLVVGVIAGAAGAEPVRVTPAAQVSAATHTHAEVLNPSVDRGDRLYVVGAVSATGVAPAGRVQLLVDGRQVDAGALTVGVATLRARLGAPGRHRVLVRYSGAGGALGSESDEVTVTVR